MNSRTRPEAYVTKNNKIILILSKIEDENLVKDFCGEIFRIDNLFLQNLPSLAKKIVYLCGDISMADGLELNEALRVFVIQELSVGYRDSTKSWSMVDLGQLPLLINGLGVFYRRFFDPGLDYFKRICDEHTFQTLTESNKPSKAQRSGIYLTPVTRDSGGLHFRLLRCSTNFAGPTENFGPNDSYIVDALNMEAGNVFENQASLNHILAQVYQNTPATNMQKQTKAKISLHADKTKDMPPNGIMAFCTFYDNIEELNVMPQDAFDYGYKNTSGLTKLRFCLKDSAEEDSVASLPKEFTVTLYPGSVFFIPLSTNRFYTHEIKPSMLDAGRLPARLGYVVRCSETEVVHSTGHTFLKKNGELTILEQPTPEGMDQLRMLYAEENKTDGFIDYGEKFLFSMNEGDYQAPKYNLRGEFQQYTLPLRMNIFDKLFASVRFEDVGKGRQGSVLVNTDEARGVPIVRTTTKYHLPAQNFQSIHMDIAQHIKKCASLPLSFNNALIECYTEKYTSMGFHSDQSQDLEDNSTIAIFSCYKYPELEHNRTLIIESKKPGGDLLEIPLKHNSVVAFSLETNRRFKHKIVLDPSTKHPENQWLGITFRNSKTFVRNHRNRTYFEDGVLLTIASEEESSEFYPLRRRENNETNFLYPRITYTLSESDIMPPEDLIGPEVNVQ